MWGRGSGLPAVATGNGKQGASARAAADNDQRLRPPRTASATMACKRTDWSCSPPRTQIPPPPPRDWLTPAPAGHLGTRKRPWAGGQVQPDKRRAGRRPPAHVRERNPPGLKAMELAIGQRWQRRGAAPRASLSPAAQPRRGLAPSRLRRRPCSSPAGCGQRPPLQEPPEPTARPPPPPTAAPASAAAVAAPAPTGGGPSR